MASILQFIPRQPLSPSWSDEERARLYDFASAMAESCGVRIDFGQTDEGDPWCVVLDDNEDVLVHIARIDGTFVAHSVAQDLVEQASELSATLDRTLSARAGVRSDVVIPFPSNRSSQIVTAVLVAAAFSWSSDSEAHEPLAAATVTDGSSGAPEERPDAITITLSIDLLTDLARTPSPGMAGPTASARTPLLAVVDPVLHPAMVLATAVSQPSGMPGPDDVAATTPVPDEPAYFARQTGDRAPPPPAIDLPSPTPTNFIVGTSGDDNLLVGDSAIVSGGAGADQFVVAVPPAGNNSSLGVILDFGMDEGDTLQLTPVAASTTGLMDRMSVPTNFTPANGAQASILSVQAVADIRPVATFGEPIEGVRLGIDFDADGREDGFLLLGGVGEADAVRAFNASPVDLTTWPLPTADSEPPLIITLSPEADLPVSTTVIG